MFQNTADIERFILAGNAVFTLESEKTGAHFTYRVTRAPEGRNPVYFVGVLTGPNNEDDYSYAGILRMGTAHDTNPHREVFEFRTTAKSRIAATALSVVGFKWFWDRVSAGRMPAGVTMRHSGSCGRCGRTLTTPESIERGIGPECAKTMGIATVKPLKSNRTNGPKTEVSRVGVDRPLNASPAWLAN